MRLSGRLCWKQRWTITIHMTDAISKPSSITIRTWMSVNLCNIDVLLQSHNVSISTCPSFCKSDNQYPANFKGQKLNIMLMHMCFNVYLPVQICMVSGSLWDSLLPYSWLFIHFLETIGLCHNPAQR